MEIDLSGWEYRDRIEGIKIWYTNETTENVSGRFYLDEIGFSSGRGNVGVIIAICAISVVVVAGAVVAIVLVRKKRKA